MNAKQVVYNDKCKPLVNIFRNLDSKFVDEVKEMIDTYKLNKFSKQEFLNLRSYYNTNLKDNLDSKFVDEVKEMIDTYKLNKFSKQEFLNLRSYYNTNLKDNLDRENAVVLYCLITHAFNYQIAFNKSREFNMPSGASRSYFSKSLEDKLVKYIEAIDKKNISFYSSDFHNLNLDSPEFNDTFYYCDPPYLITVGGYERDYFCKWSEDYERELLNLLDIINSKGGKFALSNVTEHKGKENTILKEWSKNYNTHYLIKDYNNCNYQTKVKTGNSSIEVLITNY